MELVMGQVREWFEKLWGVPCGKTTVEIVLRLQFVVCVMQKKFVSEELLKLSDVARCEARCVAEAVDVFSPLML